MVGQQFGVGVWCVSGLWSGLGGRLDCEARLGTSILRPSKLGIRLWSEYGRQSAIVGDRRPPSVTFTSSHLHRPCVQHSTRSTLALLRVGVEYQPSWTNQRGQMTSPSELRRSFGQTLPLAPTLPPPLPSPTNTLHMHVTHLLPIHVPSLLLISAGEGCCGIPQPGSHSCHIPITFLSLPYHFPVPFLCSPVHLRCSAP